MIEAKSIFAQKNREYGDSIRYGGVLGPIIEFIGLSGRLKKLIVLNPKHGRGLKKLLRNILMDMIVYSVIAMMMMNENNWEGEKDENISRNPYKMQRYFRKNS